MRYAFMCYVVFSAWMAFYTQRMILRNDRRVSFDPDTLFEYGVGYILLIPLWPLLWFVRGCVVLLQTLGKFIALKSQERAK